MQSRIRSILMFNLIVEEADHVPVATVRDGHEQLARSQCADVAVEAVLAPDLTHSPHTITNLLWPVLPGLPLLVMRTLLIIKDMYCHP